MMITSSSRDEKKKCPSSSFSPASPVRYQRPSGENRSLVFSGASAYSLNHMSGLRVRSIATRPRVPGGAISSRSGSSTSAHQPGIGWPIEPGLSDRRIAGWWPLMIAMPSSVWP
ncbi:hypothetical protein [Carbonactinospora thermoautotrophica]|uniref:hypothetical protein n=1 Tax=Carbonactinospora thermoautotrophica TaxID=1469144 RepID=UPI003DA8D9D6